MQLYVQDQSKNIGKVSFKIPEAKLFRDVDLIGKQDPYCVIEFDG